MKSLAAVVVLSTISLAAVCQHIPQADVQLSHIEANVPEEKLFAAFLKRDLVSYFQSAGFPAARSARFELLRDAPTQSGVAYPKYYAWAQAYEGPQLVAEGAVRVAAIARTHFEVTDFIPRSALLLISQ